MKYDAGFAGFWASLHFRAAADEGSCRHIALGLAENIRLRSYKIGHYISEILATKISTHGFIEISRIYRKASERSIFTSALRIQAAAQSKTAPKILSAQS